MSKPTLKIQFRKKNIALIGLMGSGKTTIGAKLADKINYYFIDSDSEIEDYLGKSINDIFAIHGEKYFREVEHKIICEVLERDEPTVLSLGGGAFINSDTRKILLDNAVVVWLDASVETIFRRLRNKNNRPLLNQQKNRREFLQSLANTRAPFYSLADCTIKVDLYSTQEEIINELLNQIK